MTIDRPDTSNLSTVDDWWTGLLDPASASEHDAEPTTVDATDPSSKAFLTDADGAVDLTGLSTPVWGAICRYFGGHRDRLTMHEVAEVLSADLCALPNIGPIRAERIRRELAARAEHGPIHAPIHAPIHVPETVVGQHASVQERELVRQIWRESMRPDAAAALIGVAFDDVRPWLEARFEVDDRVARILRVWDWIDQVSDGRTLQQVADEAGITRERVRQLLKRFGVNARAVRADIRRRDALDRRSIEQRVVETIRAFPGITPAEAVHVLDLDEKTFERMAWSVRHLILRPAEIDEHDRLGDRRATCLDSIRRAGEVHNPLSGDAYERLVTDGVVPGPGRQTAMTLFGSWAAACAAAGVSPGHTVRDHYERQWSDDEIDAVVADYLVDPTTPGTADGYEAWAAVRSAPSPALVRNRRFGSWKEAVRRALVVARLAWANDRDEGDFDDWLLAS